ncbi:hypothetical protein PHMEG_00033380 [Phytophthora megakarya]|uniref:Uncharacterized protein n=1 Tax=Phytophthora megakarya TaxID=4795 RepID=A0A225UT49_9STRA|nr:hypothetical protein PHMEG_00033380 [Phytophthora megakarya]
MMARCQSTGETYEAVTRSMKASFDPKLLEASCRLRWNIKKKNVNDKTLLVEIDNIISSVKIEALPDVRALFKTELRLNLKESDVNERILQYFMGCDRVIEEHAKEKCTLLVSSLAPEALKEDVKNDKEFCRSKQQRSDGDMGKKPRRKVVLEASKSSWSTHRDHDKERESLEERQTLQRSVNIPEKGCLKCKGPHWLSKCPTPTDTEKRDLPRQFHKEKSKLNVKRLRTDN